MRAGRLACVLAALLGPALTSAQARPAEPLREPPLFDTQWGDFPLERVQPGARLRLTWPDGRREEVQVTTLVDRTLSIQSNDGYALPPLTFADLRAFRLVEVRAMPAWRERAGNIGFIAGAAVGALAGLAVHKGRGDTPRGEDAPTLFDDVGAYASMGFLAGWLTGRHVVGRVRWRVVTVP